MKILKLSVDNFMKLVAVEIEPSGNLVQITGKNGQGKTSVLNAIWAALAGKDACPVVPIRKGQERATIRLDLGEIVVTRTFARHKEGGEYTTNITVENAAGARFPSPQRLLDALLGELSFDPLAFARMDPKDQFNALRRFVPDVDFEAIANADRGDRERRTELGRFAKQEHGAAVAITVPQDTPEESVDESALVAELEAAGRENAQLEQRRANRERVAREAQDHRRVAKEIADTITDLREKIADLEERQTAAIEKAATLDKQINTASPLPEMVDTSSIRLRIDHARATNANVRKLEERTRHRTRAAELDKQVETITAQIEKRQADKRTAIAAAKMPVEGLGFGEEQILFNGLPFEQASDAEQLRVSVAIAMALNPKLRVVRIRDGSLLDEDALQLLGQMADANDIQVWVERVDSTGKLGIVLEDGHVRGRAEERGADQGRLAV